MCKNTKLKCDYECQSCNLPKFKHEMKPERRRKSGVGRLCESCYKNKKLAIARKSRKKYYENHKTKCLLQNANYREITNYYDLWYSKNKSKRKQYNEEYYKKNRVKIQKRKKQNREINKNLKEMLPKFRGKKVTSRECL